MNTEPERQTIGYSALEPAVAGQNGGVSALSHVSIVHHTAGTSGERGGG
jgi:hypothetical protein